LRNGRWFGFTLALLLAGCGSTPRNFQGMMHPSGVVRARSVAQNQGQPDFVTIPALIDRLQDPDPVVQLTANEELKRITGQDFGFANWLDKEERLTAAGRWRAWWIQRQAGLGNTR